MYFTGAGASWLGFRRVDGGVSVDGCTGYKALEMVHGIYESARTHTQVGLPMKTLVHPLAEMIDSGHLPVTYPGMFDIRNQTLRGENTTLDTENV